MGKLCEYSEILGRPGEGAHAPRLGGYAAVDLLLTGGVAALGGYAANKALGTTGPAAYVIVLIVLLLLAVAAHEAFCVDTRLNAQLFGRQWPGGEAAAGGAQAARRARPRRTWG